MTGATAAGAGGEPDAPAPTPFLILTGFLGAGKTTTLNRLLGAPHGRRIAVLVNELGRIAIDTRLVLARGNDVLELAGGCVCCKIDVKNDLWDGIADVVARSRPEHVLLETTGVAEPRAILDGLAELPQLAPAGVVCVVDAEAAMTQLDRREEAREQVASADRLLLGKLDLTGGAALVELHERLRALAPAAERAAFPPGPEGDLALAHWLLEVRAPAPAAGTPHAAHRDGQLTAATYADDAPLSPELVLGVVAELGDALLRAKGFVHVAGDDRRWILERAGLRTTLRPDAPWLDARRRNELVLIGDGLEEAALRRRLWACRSGG